jgi:hypothetical protein
MAGPGKTQSSKVFNFSSFEFNLMWCESKHSHFGIAGVPMNGLMVIALTDNLANRLQRLTVYKFARKGQGMLPGRFDEIILCKEVGGTKEIAGRGGRACEVRSLT